jgi:hypothetical protein
MVKLLPMVAIALLGACSFGGDEPTVIDGSSAEAFEQTLREAKRELGPKDRIKFETALAEFRAQMFAKAGTRQEYQRLVRKGMDGLTAPLIVSKFNSNVDKAGRDVADTVFSVKRAITGAQREPDETIEAPASKQLEERSSEEQRRHQEEGVEQEGQQ